MKSVPIFLAAAILAAASTGAVFAVSPSEVPRFTLTLDGTPIEAQFEAQTVLPNAAQGVACPAITRERPPSLEVEITSTNDGPLPAFVALALAEDTYGFVLEDPSGQITCQVSNETSVGTFRSLINRPAGVFRFWIVAVDKTEANLTLTIPD